MNKRVSMILVMVVVMFSFPLITNANSWMINLYGSFGIFRADLEDYPDLEDGKEYCHPKFEGVRMLNLDGLDVGRADRADGSGRVIVARNNVVQFFKPDGFDDWEQEGRQIDDLERLFSQPDFRNPSERPSSVSGPDLGVGGAYAAHIEPLNHPSGYDPENPNTSYTPERIDNATNYDCGGGGGTGNGHTMVDEEFADNFLDSFNASEDFDVGDLNRYRLDVYDERDYIHKINSNHDPIEDPSRNSFDVGKYEDHDPLTTYRLREIAEESGAKVDYSHGHVYITLTEKPRVDPVAFSGGEGNTFEVGDNGEIILKGEAYDANSDGERFVVEADGSDPLGIEGEYSGSDEVGSVPGRDFGEKYENSISFTASEEGSFNYKVTSFDTAGRESYNEEEFTVMVGVSPEDLCPDGSEKPCDTGGGDPDPAPDPEPGESVDAPKGSVSCDTVSGSGDVVFSPDNTEGDIRDWSQSNVGVDIGLNGESKEYDIECTVDVSWDYTQYTSYESKAEVPYIAPHCDDWDTDEDGNSTCSDWDSGQSYEPAEYDWNTSSKTEEWSYTYTSSWELGSKPIDITSDDTKGSVSVNNSFNDGARIRLDDETYELVLSGETQVSDWVNTSNGGDNAGSRQPSSKCSDSAPSDPTGTGQSECEWGSRPSMTLTPSDAPNVTWSGESGEYNIDLEDIEPVEVSPESVGWTNRSIRVDMSLGENFSGIYESGSTYRAYNIAREYSGSTSGGFDDDGETETLSDSKRITIRSDGIHEIEVESEDYAGYTTGPDVYGEYKYDNTDPYEADFDNAQGDCEIRTIPGTGRRGFDCIADSSNELTVTIGDNLSGVNDTEFSWSKSASDPTDGGWGWNDLPVGTSEDQPHNGVGYDREEIDVKVHSRTRHNSAVTDYNQLKEGLWYLHIRQEDRAGNVETTVSDPIFINKIKNLRIVEVTDPTWEDVFYNTDGSKKPARVQGIYPEWMPVYSNFENKPIKLGYKVKYRMDIVGFNGSGDKVDVDFSYHAMDRTNKIYKDAEVYVEGDNSGNYIPLDNSRYAGRALSYDIGPSTGSSYEDRLVRNEDDSSYNRGYNYYDESNYRNAYRTVHREIYLPPTAKVVKRGDNLDLVSENDIDYRMIVGQTIRGYRSGVGSLDYTAMEDKWSNNNNFGNGMNSIYGKNRPTYQNLNDKGGSNGSLFWYQLDRTALDDVDSGRPY